MRIMSLRNTMLIVVAGVCIFSAQGATTWVETPASQYTSGDSINFSWNLDVSGTNTHVDYSTDNTFATNVVATAAQIDYSYARNFADAITAPAVAVPTTYYFRARTSNTLSSVVVATISPPNKISWIKQPQSQYASGSTISCTWNISGSATDTEIYYDLSTRFDTKSTTIAQSGAVGNYVATFTAPSVAIATSYFIKVHASIAGVDYYSTFAQITIYPSAPYGNPPAQSSSQFVTWTTQPAPQYSSGDSINFSWYLDVHGANTYVEYSTDSNFVSGVTATGSQIDYSYSRIFTDAFTAPVVAAPTTYYFRARISNSISSVAVVTISPANKIAWINTPAAHYTTGSPINVSWTSSAATTDTEIYYDNTFFYDPVSTTSAQSGAAGTYSAILTAPVVTTPTVYYFKAHGTIGGVDYYTTFAQATINPAPPSITSSLTANGVVGTAFNYQIVATNSPISYDAAGLPAGLSVSTSTGAITGNPTVPFKGNVTLTATNASGKDTKLLALTILPLPPSITSALTASGSTTSVFNYQITATNSPTSFDAPGLPAGITVSTATGAITGTATAPFSGNITISAANAGGTGSATLALTITAPAPPVITSPLTATGSTTAIFNYQIAATNTPTSFDAPGLPAGLTVSTSTGKITGTPTAAFSGNITISAANAGGTGTASLALTITAPSAPVITSALTATGAAGSFFTYQITASNTPTSFDAQGLPVGITVSTATGKITGTPTVAFNGNVTISATNAGGTGSAMLALNITGPAGTPPAITSAASAIFAIGTAKTVTLTTTGNPTAKVSSAGALPSGIVFVDAGNGSATLSGTAAPGTAGTYPLTITADNSVPPAATQNFTLTVSATGAGQPPVVVVFASQQNPGLINTAIPFLLTATDPDSKSLTYSVSFGDGAAPATGSLTAGTPATIMHTFSVGGTFTATATVSDGQNVITATTPEEIPAPSSLGLGVPNISTGKPGIVNPLNSISVGVSGSNGGVLQLGVNVDSLPRSAYDVTTFFDDIVARTALVPGLNPVHRFVHYGIFVSKATAADHATGTIAGIARKMLNISAKETGEAAPNVSAAFPRVVVIGTPPTSAIVTKNVKGKFAFGGGKSDTVVYTGTIKLPPGLNTSATHDFSIGIGNIVVNSSIDAKGKATSATGVLKTLKVTYLKVKKGAVTKGGEDAQIDASFSTSGMIAAGFDTEGIDVRSTDVKPGKGTAQRNIQVAINLAGVSYEALAPVIFSVSKDSLFGSIAARH